jgi:diacylglycerol diphosphate phosphatase/phosphatidate phosphatase
VAWTTAVYSCYFVICETVLIVGISSDHWQDLVAGTTLGLTIAYFCYRQYYPCLSSKYSHLPYAPRTTPGDATRLPVHYSQTSFDSIHESLEGRLDASREPLRDSDLDRTVQRGGPGPLEEVWREGQEEGERGGYPI